MAEKSKKWMEVEHNLNKTAKKGKTRTRNWNGFVYPLKWREQEAE